MSTLVDDVIRREWAMFIEVQNVGGPASCQQDMKTFKIMRESQFKSWPENALQSYLDDLEMAARQGRNLLSEKYAFMMESTHPLEFAQLKSRLPLISESMLKDIETITSTHMAWEKEFADNFPLVRRQGRPASSADDASYQTSIQTYMANELKTCSPKTVRLLREFTEECKAKGKNQVLEIMENTVREYGYSSLKDAEETMGAVQKR